MFYAANSGGSIANGQTVDVLDVQYTATNPNGASILAEASVTAAPKTAGGQAIQCWIGPSATPPSGAVIADENTGRVNLMRTLAWADYFSATPGTFTTSVWCKVFGGTTGDDYDISPARSIIVRSVG